uniref:Uncharacterized protein n=1 Tax=Arundo donax TaxID=35708 RepID=A0A0A9AB61_ARUDO
MKKTHQLTTPLLWHFTVNTHNIPASMLVRNCFLPLTLLSSRS